MKEHEPEDRDPCPESRSASIRLALGHSGVKERDKR